MLFKIGFLIIAAIGLYFGIGLLIGLCLSWEDYKRFGDNRWLTDDMRYALLWGIGAIPKLKKFKEWYYSKRQRELRSIQTRIQT